MNESRQEKPKPFQVVGSKGSREKASYAALRLYGEGLTDDEIVEALVEMGFKRYKPSSISSLCHTAKKLQGLPTRRRKSKKRVYDAEGARQVVKRHLDASVRIHGQYLSRKLSEAGYCNHEGKIYTAKQCLAMASQMRRELRGAGKGSVAGEKSVASHTADPRKHTGQWTTLRVIILVVVMMAIASFITSAIFYAALAH